MAFNKVNTQAEAAAFKFLKDQSTVLRTIESNEITVNGVNVITKTPEQGDVLCVTTRKDGSGTLLGADKQDVVWIKGNTVSFAQWPATEDDNDYIYEPVGVCYKVRGGHAYCRFRSEVSRRWSEADRWQVTNPTVIQNMNGTVSMTVSATTGCASQTVSVTNCVSGNLRNNCIRIQAALEAITNTTVACQYCGPHDYDDIANSGNHYSGSDGVVIFSARFTADAWNTVTCTIGGTALTFSRCIGRDIPADYTNYRANGAQQYWGGCNFYRFYDYYSVNGVDLTSAPTSTITTDYPLKESVFNNSQYAAAFRAQYGTYKNYLRSCMVQWPTQKGANGLYFNKGKEFTEKLAKATYLDMSTNHGVTHYLYGPAHYCGVEVSANGPGLTSGNWWLPSSGEMIELMQDVTYGTSEYDTNGHLDPINEAIFHLNNDTFDPTNGFRFDLHSAGPLQGSIYGYTYLWASDRYNQYRAYHYNGLNGYINSGNFYFRMIGSAVSKLAL